MTDSSPAIEKSSSPTGGQDALVRRVVRIVLIALLFLALIALAYDHLVARPRNQAEFDLIQQLVDAKNANPLSKPITNKDVQEALGRAPSRTEEKDFYTLEFYTWPRGVLIDSYYICVVYSPKDKMLLHAVQLNELPDPLALPGGFLKPEGSTEEARPAGSPIGLGGPGTPAGNESAARPEAESAAAPEEGRAESERKAARPVDVEPPAP